MKEGGTVYNVYSWLWCTHGFSRRVLIQFLPNGNNNSDEDRTEHVNGAGKQLL